MRFQKRYLKVIKKIKTIDWKVIKLFIYKELSKIVLIPFLFLLIRPLIGEIFIKWYGLEEYLKHETLRLFVDSYYIGLSLTYGHPFKMYYAYITEKLGVDFCLWSIPYSIAIIYCYIAYLIAHKIVDRSGIGATKKLNFFYFFFIFGISSILTRIVAFDVLEKADNLIIGYIIYKSLKIGVLKFKEKRINKGEKDV